MREPGLGSLGIERAHFAKRRRTNASAINPPPISAIEAGSGVVDSTPVTVWPVERRPESSHTHNDNCVGLKVKLAGTRINLRSPQGRFTLQTGPFSRKYHHPLRPAQLARAGQSRRFARLNTKASAGTTISNADDGSGAPAIKISPLNFSSNIEEGPNTPAQRPGLA
jgi:hypothetical protein